jgi:alkylation response protein AidB-like acyl-CoA dehydrogenase
MNFAFSEEQEELRRTVRQFLEAKSPETEVRRLMETTEGYDPSVWKQMGQELGLQGLAIPEEYGGQGFTFIELGIVLEEMGRVLLCAPYFASAVLAANRAVGAVRAQIGGQPGTTLTLAAVAGGRAAIGHALSTSAD